MHVLFLKSNILKVVANVYEHNMPPSPMAVYLQIASYNTSAVATVKLLEFICLVYSNEVPKRYYIVSAVSSIRSVCTQKFVPHLNEDAKF